MSKMEITRNDCSQKLNTIKNTLSGASFISKNINVVPDSVYEDSEYLLDLFENQNISMPDIGWLIAGGLIFKWISHSTDSFNATMSIFEDGRVEYQVFSMDCNRNISVEGKCTARHQHINKIFVTVLKGFI